MHVQSTAVVFVEMGRHKPKHKLKHKPDGFLGGGGELVGAGDGDEGVGEGDDGGGGDSPSMSVKWLLFKRRQGVRHDAARTNCGARGGRLTVAACIAEGA